MDRDLPAVGFHFEVSIGDLGTQATFKEVSGISLSLETETITEGGVNRFAHKVPGRTSYSDLVLKRGLVASSSPLADWCRDTMEDDLTNRIEPKLVIVSLLNEEHDPIMRWSFDNAYPIKWEVSTLDAMKSEIVIESITFAYNYFTSEPV